jgi:DNA-binding NtrC family response regulator
LLNPVAPRRDRVELLIVDDDRDLGDALAELLKSKGLAVTTRQTCQEAAALLRARGDQLQILLSDLRLPDGDGLQLIEIAKLKNPNVLAALMTGYASLETALKAIQLGAYDYITKPFSLNQIEILIRNMCDKIRLEDQTRYAEKEIRQANERLREIYAKIDILQDEKIELMRLNREMKREFAGLSNKMDQVLQLLQALLPQGHRGRWSDEAPPPAARLIE